MIDFISGPVSSGFTSAVALLILSSQVKDILGIKAGGATFVEMWISISKDIVNSSLWDTIMGIACIIVLLLMRVCYYLKIFIKIKCIILMKTIEHKCIYIFSYCQTFVLVLLVHTDLTHLTIF